MVVGTDRVEVRVNLGGKSIPAGLLVRDGDAYFFQYYPDYLKRGHSLSPLKLDWSGGIQRAETNVFNGLYGVFADSLPDGWGRLVMERSLVERGVDLDTINELDRLCLVGQAGPGALTYHPANQPHQPATGAVELDDIATGANLLLRGEDTTMLEDLVQLGGSSGGARPKILIGYNPSTEELLHGAERLPDDFEHWIIKFPATVDPSDVANLEYAYYLMAIDAGLEMSECRLFTGKSGRQFFGTKRFDRAGNDRLHLHSAAGLFHDNFRATSIDYGHVMQACTTLGAKQSDAVAALRLAAFNVATHNHDDHAKNISLLMDDQGQWRLAPAYDLTFSRSNFGYHSMTVAGARKPGWKDLERLAEDFGVKDFASIRKPILAAIGDWAKYAKVAGVGRATMREVGKLMLR